ncbi:hypothetical protein RB595_004124 [Gaeumannomyces hyphopodioides]
MPGPSSAIIRAATRRGLLTRVPMTMLRPASNAARTATAAAKASSPAIPATASAHARWMGTSSSRSKGLSPESENPIPPKISGEDLKSAPVMTAAPLEDAEYHELADEYLEGIIGKFEDLQDQRPEVDVEFSAGVLTLTFPPNGTYVINKQPPNKQIWLSSPITGPKRYDWVVIGDGQGEKEGTASGDWIYLRDGSSLSQLILEELDVDVSAA